LYNELSQVVERTVV